MTRVAIDLYAGEAHLDGVRVAVASAERGALRLGTSVLRPLTFGERERAVRGALAAANTRQAVADAVRRAATVSPGEVEIVIAEILALHLAGARTDGGATFEETMLRVAQASGWPPRAIEDAEAVLIDRLAARVAPPEVEDGWTRFVFHGGADNGLPTLRDALASDLLARVDAGDRTVEEAPAPSEAATRSPASDATGASASVSPPVRPTVPSRPSKPHDALVRARPGRATQPELAAVAPRSSARLAVGPLGGSPAATSAALVSASAGETIEPGSNHEPRRGRQAEDPTARMSSPTPATARAFDVGPPGATRAAAAEERNATTASVRARRRSKPFAPANVAVAASDPPWPDVRTHRHDEGAPRVAAPPTLAVTPTASPAATPVGADPFASSRQAEALAALLDETSDLRGVDR